MYFFSPSLSLESELLRDRLRMKHYRRYFCKSPTRLNRASLSKAISSMLYTRMHWHPLSYCCTKVDMGDPAVISSVTVLYNCYAGSHRATTLPLRRFQRVHNRFCHFPPNQYQQHCEQYPKENYLHYIEVS